MRVGPVVDEDGTEVTPCAQLSVRYSGVGGRQPDQRFRHAGSGGLRDLAGDARAGARRFHRRLVNACIRAHNQTAPLRPGQLQVIIIGAGATGVELAAELHKTTRDLVAFGLDRIDPDKDITLHLIEAANRILPALPPRISEAATDLLRKLGVKVYTSARVAAVMPNEIKLADGHIITAELVVWAAGVMAPACLRNIDGLETNAINQLLVRQTLQTTRDDDIFAIGDCAACPWPERSGTVPPRAQAAHQQATHLYKQLQRRLAGRPLEPWHYRDFGSLVSLGEYSTVGSLMGKLIGRSLFVEGCFARFMYRVALQDARVRAPRLHQGRARHARPPHHAAHRAACQTALVAAEPSAIRWRVAYRPDF